ncbi:MAG: DUF3828 domain-containing protein [Acidobacteriota bacterium]
MKRKVYFGGLMFVLVVFGFSACRIGTGSSTNVTISTANANSSPSSNGEPAATPVAGSAQSPVAMPETLVAELYKAHDAQKSPFFQTKDRSLVDKYFSKPLADLIWKDAISSGNEVGAIDGDPLYNAQDVEIKNFAVGKGEVKGDKANVPVTFTNFGKKQSIIFALVTVNGGWKIENIIYGNGENLLKWLKEPAGDTPDVGSTAGGNFAGRYQIGSTSCTVKPVKMAFEVHWAKGSGVEMFFSKNGTTFESSPDKGESNRFEFDDESLSTGVFYRADGTEFPIKRLK